MFEEQRYWLSSKWFSYWYNRGWHNIDAWANGTVTRFTISIPLFGYLILFNDEIVKHLNFTAITGEQSDFVLSSSARLQFVYFGLVFLAVASGWYRWRRPLVVKQAIRPNEYVRHGIESYTIFDLIQLFGEVNDKDTGPVTNYWEFGREDLDKFILDVEGNQKTGGPLKRDLANSRQQALDKNSEFVRSLLLEYYARRTRERKIEQSFLMLLCLSAYTMLAIPSLDFFWAVVRAVFP